MIISETSKLMLNTFQYGARTSSPAVFRIRIALFGSVRCSFRMGTAESILPNDRQVGITEQTELQNYIPK
jgi:hypothetical protein